MKINMGETDRVIRAVAAIVLAVLYFTNILGGTLGLVALILAFILMATATIRFCPLYLPFGLNTLRKKLNSK